MPLNIMPRLKSYGKKKRKPQDKFYKRAVWVKLRNMKIRKNPLCEVCESQGLVVEAKDVDHYKPKRLFPELAINYDNLTSLCKDCHYEKTKEIDGKSQSRESWQERIQGTKFEK